MELLLSAYTTATATWDLSWVCDLHHSSWQCRILNPLSEARDRTHNLWFLVGFVSAAPRRELLHPLFDLYVTQLNFQVLYLVSLRYSFHLYKILYLPFKIFILFFIKSFFFFFGLFRAVPMAYGGSQARERIRAVVAILRHSHSNPRSEPCLRPTPELMANARSLPLLSEAREGTCILMDTSQIHFRWAMMAI